MHLEEANELAQIDCAAPIVFAARKDGSLGFRDENQNLLAVANGEVYPILSMDKCIYSLCEPAVFPTLNANSGNWQVEFKDKDRARLPLPYTTAFIDLRK